MSIKLCSQHVHVRNVRDDSVAWIQPIRSFLGIIIYRRLHEYTFPFKTFITLNYSYNEYPDCEYFKRGKGKN